MPSENQKQPIYTADFESAFEVQKLIKTRSCLLAAPVEIARSYGRCGSSDRAEAVLVEAFEKYKSEGKNFFAWFDLGLFLTTVPTWKNHKVLRELLLLSAERLDGFKDYKALGIMYADLMQAAKESGEFDLAEQFYQSAAKVIYDIRSDKQRISYILDIAAFPFEQGCSDTMEILLGAIERTLSKMKSPRDHAAEDRVSEFESGKLDSVASERQSLPRNAEADEVYRSALPGHQGSRQSSFGCVLRTGIWQVVATAFGSGCVEADRHAQRREGKWRARMTTLLDFLRTAEPATNVWDYVSASRLNLWSKCPLAFRRRYVDGIESAPSVSMFVGKVVHSVLEHVYRCRSIGTIATESDLPVFVEAAWTRTMELELMFFDDEAHEAKCRQQVHDLATAYLREIDIEAERPIAVEKRYETQLIDPLTGEDLGLPLAEGYLQCRP